MPCPLQRRAARLVFSCCPCTRVLAVCAPSSHATWVTRVASTCIQSRFGERRVSTFLLRCDPTDRNSPCKSSAGKLHSSASTPRVTRDHWQTDRPNERVDGCPPMGGFSVPRLRGASLRGTQATAQSSSKPNQRRRRSLASWQASLGRHVPGAQACWRSNILRRWFGFMIASMRPQPLDLFDDSDPAAQARGFQEAFDQWLAHQRTSVSRKITLASSVRAYTVLWQAFAEWCLSQAPV